MTIGCGPQEKRGLLLGRPALAGYCESSHSPPLRPGTYAAALRRFPYPKRTRREAAVTAKVAISTLLNTNSVWNLCDVLPSPR